MKTKKFIGIIGVIGVFILGFCLWFLIEIHNQKDPQFFPFNDRSSVYTVIKDSSGLIEIKYEGKNSKFSNENQFTVLVGDSSVDLNKYLDSKIIPLEGNFSTRTFQCIVGICKSIGGPYVAININKIEVVSK